MAAWDSDTDVDYTLRASQWGGGTDLMCSACGMVQAHLASAGLPEMMLTAQVHHWEKHGGPPLRSEPADETERTLWQEQRTPWQIDRDDAEDNGTWPALWGPFHRHTFSDAVHRDTGPECDQEGSPRRVYVFDPDALDSHERIVARWGAAHPELFSEPAD